MTNEEFGDYVKQSILSLNSNMERLVEKVDTLADAVKTDRAENREQISELRVISKRLSRIARTHEEHIIDHEGHTQHVDETLRDLNERIKKLERKRNEGSE